MKIRLTILIVALILTGCGNSLPLVAIRTTTEPKRSIGVTFGHAYYGKSNNGEDQVVLIHQPIDDAPNQQADQPLVRQTAPALTQILVIKLHWSTAPSASSDSPVANNAVLHWYVYGDPSDAGMGLLHYVGNGAVTFTPDQNTSAVIIHSGELTLQDQNGGLHDPFGSFKIDASFSAKLNQPLMQQTMDDVNKSVGKAVPAGQN